MAYKIHFWHGFNQKLADKLMNDMSDTVCLDGEDGDEYEWFGTLDQFADEYDGNFIVMGKGTICVTQHNNFGQR